MHSPLIGKPNATLHGVLSMGDKSPQHLVRTRS